MPLYLKTDVLTGAIERWNIGLLLGTLFGHSALLSSWIVFGPGGWMRIVFALAWASVSPIALAIGDVIYDLPDPTTLWAAEVTTILLVQLVAWPIWYWFHAKIVCDLDEASKI